MNDTIISGLQKRLEDSILPNPENHDPIAFLNRLLYTQHEFDAWTLRKQKISQSKLLGSDNGDLATYSDRIRLGKYQTDVLLENTVAKYKKPRRQSVDLHSIPDTSKENGEDDENDENLSQLKQRLLQGHRQKAPEAQSFDQQLQSEESKQEDLLNDMFQFVQGIKEGANVFNDKLNEDQNVLKAAEAGLNITSAKLKKSRNDLSKTIKNLGLLDSLKIFGVIILVFLLSLIIIKIFPKW